MKNFFATLCCAFLLLSCNGQQSGNIEKITPAQFSEKLKSENNPQLLDVRTPGEFSGGTIPGALNMDFFSPAFANKVKQLDQEPTYFVFCRSGNRSGQACKMMHQLGFDVRNLSGGIGAFPA